MDEETVIIDTKTRNEKIRNFFINNQKKIISVIILFVILIISYFIYGEYKEKKKNRNF